jgi:hypothetical protein
VVTLISSLGAAVGLIWNVVWCWELEKGAQTPKHPRCGPVYASSYDLSVRDGQVITDVVTAVLVFVSVSVFLAHAFDAYRAS